MKCIIADDHALYRAGLRLTFESIAPDAEIIEAASYTEVTDVLKTHHDADLLSMDLNMPKMNGLQGLEKIRQKYPDISTMVISMHEDPVTISSALELGVSGYVPKSRSIECVNRAIRTILEGDRYIPQEVMAQSSQQDQPYWTKRQRGVLELIKQGKSNQEISNELYISVSTVKMHVGAIMEKLQVKNRTQVVVASMKDNNHL